MVSVVSFWGNPSQLELACHPATQETEAGKLRLHIGFKSWLSSFMRLLQSESHKESKMESIEECSLVLRVSPHLARGSPYE